MPQIKNTIIFIPKFNLYDVVCHKTDKNKQLLVINFVISKVNDEGDIQQYTVGCGNADAVVNYFFPDELDLYVPKLIDDETSKN